MLEGQAEVVIDGTSERLPCGALALIPKEVPHEVRNPGASIMRFVAFYAEADVVSTYDQPVQPSGERERHPVG